MGLADEPLGQQLRRYRVRAGLTQEELADKAGLSVRGLANIECGRVGRPHSYSLERLAQALGLSTPEREGLTRRRLRTLHHRLGSSPASLEPIRQLPSDISDFTARDDEVTSISTFVRATAPSGPRTVVITGQGGIGKTALAVHVAHAVVDDFPDGQLFVNLGGHARPQTAAAALGRMLRALGVDAKSYAAADLDERASAFRSIVAPRRVLIVLDNAVSEEQARPLLPGSGKSATIITSRRGLPSLESTRTVELALLSPAQSHTLLGRLISADRVGREPAALRDIARNCGGLPLAVRIAGARMAARPHATLTSFARELDDEKQRLDRLQVGDLAVRASIELSYDALPEKCRRVLRHLAYLNLHAFSERAVETLVSGAEDSASSIADGLATHRLLEISGTDPSGDLRYGMHDLVRVFASERARQSDSADERRRLTGRALNVWLVLAETITAGLQAIPWTSTVTPEPRVRIDRSWLKHVQASPRFWFNAERKNFSSLVYAGLAQGEIGVAWRIVDALVSPCVLYGDYDILTELSIAVNSACRGAADMHGCAATNSAAATVDFSLGNYSSSLRRYQQAHRQFSEVGDRSGMAFAATFATDAARALHEYHGSVTLREVQRWAEQAKVLVDDLDDEPFRRADLSYVLGKIYIMTNELARAQQELKKFLALAHALDKPVSQAHALFRLGTLCRLQGDEAGAESAYRQALDVNRDVGDRPGIGFVCLALATMLKDKGDQKAAMALAQEALTIFVDLHIARKAAEARALIRQLAL